MTIELRSPWASRAEAVVGGGRPASAGSAAAHARSAGVAVSGAWSGHRPLPPAAAGLGPRPRALEIQPRRPPGPAGMAAQVCLTRGSPEDIEASGFVPVEDRVAESRDGPECVTPTGCKREAPQAPGHPNPAPPGSGLRLGRPPEDLETPSGQLGQTPGRRAASQILAPV